jgi:hypothetical protein
MIGALAQQVGGLMQDRAALLDVGRAPLRPGALGGRERLFEVGLGGVRDFGDRLGVDRVDHGVGIAAFARFPHAVDEELERGLVGHGAANRRAVEQSQRFRYAY